MERRQDTVANNLAENSRAPARRREQIVKRFKSPRKVQKFPSIRSGRQAFPYFEMRQNGGG